MRTWIGLAAAAALAIAGCGSDKCPTESPGVNSVGSCQALAGATVNFPIRLCPTCNQTLSSCDTDLSAVGSGQIFLNPVVEACTSSSSCAGAGCSPNPATCTFTAPAAAPATTYTVLVFDPQIQTTRSGSLTIVASSPSCALP